MRVRIAAVVGISLGILAGDGNVGFGDDRMVARAVVVVSVCVESCFVVSMTGRTESFGIIVVSDLVVIVESL